MRTCLKLSSLLLLLFAACAGPYKHLHFHEDKSQTALQYKPVYEKQVYRCVVDGKILFKKFHLSGILFFKAMEDKSTRVIFQNEMGFTYFDFKWNSEDSFKVIQIIDQMNKPALVKTLEKDLSIFLLKDLDKPTEKVAAEDGNTFYRFTLSKGYVYYIAHSGKLETIDNTGKNKKVTTITLEGKDSPKALPDSALFTHHKAHFTIQLKKIAPHADE